MSQEQLFQEENNNDRKKICIELEFLELSVSAIVALKIYFRKVGIQNFVKKMQVFE